MKKLMHIHRYGPYEWVHFTEKGYGYSREMVSREYQDKTCIICGKVKRRFV